MESDRKSTGTRAFARLARVPQPPSGAGRIAEHIWIMHGEVPAFVKFEGPISNGGPVWRVELADGAKFP